MIASPASEADMLVYEAFRWFRERRRGSIERERQRACLVVIAFVCAIFVGSGGLGAINRVLAGYVQAPTEATFGIAPIPAR
jgi:hypothetical protein